MLELEYTWTLGDGIWLTIIVSGDDRLRNPIPLNNDNRE